MRRGAIGGAALDLFGVPMMFEMSFGRPDLARRIESAVEHVLAEGYCTSDLSASGGNPIGTSQFASRFHDHLTAAVQAL